MSTTTVGVQGPAGTATAHLTGYVGNVLVLATVSAACPFDTTGLTDLPAPGLVSATVGITLYCDGVVVASDHQAVGENTYGTVYARATILYAGAPGPHDYYVVISEANTYNAWTGHSWGAPGDATLTVSNGIDTALTGRFDAQPPTLIAGTCSSPGVPVVSLRDPGSALVTLGPIALDGDGGWSCSLPAGLPLGDYALTVNVPRTGDYTAASFSALLTIAVVSLARTVELRRQLGLLISNRTRLYRSIPLLARTLARLRRVFADPLDRGVDQALLHAALAPLHRFTCRVWINWDGTREVDETTSLLSIDGVDDVDIATRRLNSADCTITFDNGDLRYSASNRASPLYPVLSRRGQAVRIEAGYDGHLATVMRGTLDSLVPKHGDRTAALHVVARSADWQQRRVSYGPAASVTADVVMRAMLEQIGLVDGVDFVLDGGDAVLPYALAVDAVLLDELFQLAQAEGGRIFVDADGVFRFWSRSHTRRVQAQPLVTLSTLAHLYDLTRATTPQGMATEITLEYEDRQGTGTETVYQQGRPIVLPPAYQGTTGAWFPSPMVRVRCAAMDYTRWERHFPVAISAIAALAAYPNADGTGVAAVSAQGTPPASQANPEAKVYYTADLGVGEAVFTFWNMQSAPLYVTTLTLQGTPQRQSAPWAVAVEDSDAVERYGRIPDRIRNAYLPTTDVASEVAREMLAGRSAPLNRVDIPLQDGLPFLRALDVIRIVDETMAGLGFEPETFDMQVLRNDWAISADAGYTQRLQTGPALPAQFTGLASMSPSATVVVAHTLTAPPYLFDDAASRFDFAEYT